MIKGNFELSFDKTTYESSRKDLKIGFTTAVFVSLSMAIGQGIFSLQYGFGKAGLVFGFLCLVICFFFITYCQSRLCDIASELEEDIFRGELHEETHEEQHILAEEINPIFLENNGIRTMEDLTHKIDKSGFLYVLTLVSCIFTNGMMALSAFILTVQFLYDLLADMADLWLIRAIVATIQFGLIPIFNVPENTNWTLSFSIYILLFLSKSPLILIA